MREGGNLAIGIVVIVAVLIVLGSAFALVSAIFRPLNIVFWNELDYQAQKADDATSYEKRKEVETSALAYITNYEMYKSNYEAYKDSDRPGDQIYARDQRAMANKTASAYNTYFQENSFIMKNHLKHLPERLEPI